MIDCGGNAVLGYSMHFDSEGASGIVARAYGTACRLLKVDDTASSREVVLPWTKVEALVSAGSLDWRDVSSGCLAVIHRDTIELLSSRLAREMHMGPFNSHSILSSPMSEPLVWIQGDQQKRVYFRQVFPFGIRTDSGSSLSCTAAVRHAKGDYIGGGVDWGSVSGGNPDSSSIFQAEVQLLTLTVFPDHVRIKLGGLVLARSVKFLGKLEATVSDQETREGWWAELRDEIRGHAKVMCCKHIVGYTETCTIYGEVCVLTAIGTAVSLKELNYQVHYLSTDTPSSDAATSMGSSSPTYRMKSGISSAQEDADGGGAHIHRGGALGDAMATPHLSRGTTAWSIVTPYGLQLKRKPKLRRPCEGSTFMSYLPVFECIIYSIYHSCCDEDAFLLVQRLTCLIITGRRPSLSCDWCHAGLVSGSGFQRRFWPPWRCLRV